MARTKRDFRFAGTRLCFTLPATLGDRGLDPPYERLRTPADLARWCVEGGLLTEPPVLGHAELAAAVTLREAIQRVGEAVVAGRTPDGADVARINRAAAAMPLVRQLTPDATGSYWLGSTLESALAVVAADAVTVLAGPLRSRVRLCTHPSCRGLFVDESRPGRRRWCSMSTCGDKAKKSTYRARRRSPD